MSLEETRSAFLDFLSEVGDPTLVDLILGSHCLLAHDQDRIVSKQARALLDRLVSLGVSLQRAALTLAAKIISDPSEVQAQLYSARVVRENAQKESEVDEDVEREEDQNARWRSGAIATLTWLVGKVHNTLIHHIT